MNCPLRCTERYFMFEQFACFSQFSWRASIIEGWKVGDGGRVWRKSVGPIYHRSQLARHSLPLFKTTFALFRPFRIATRSAVIPSASAFYIYIYIYIHIPTTYIYTTSCTLLLLRILAHRDVVVHRAMGGVLKVGRFGNSTPLVHGPVV